MSNTPYSAAIAACFFKHRGGEFSMILQRRGGLYTTAKEVARKIPDIGAMVQECGDNKRELATRLVELVETHRKPDVAELPGGVPANEHESPRECAFREMMEEFCIIDKDDNSIIHNIELYNMFKRRMEHAKETIAPISDSGKPIMVYVVTIDHATDGNPFDWIDEKMSSTEKGPARRETCGLFRVSPTCLFLFGKPLCALWSRGFLDCGPQDQMRLAREVCYDPEYAVFIREWRQHKFVTIPLRSFNIFYLRAIATEFFGFEIIDNRTYLENEGRGPAWDFDDTLWNRLYN